MGLKHELFASYITVTLNMCCHSAEHFLPYVEIMLSRTAAFFNLFNISVKH